MREGFTIHHNGPNTGLLRANHERCIAYWNGVKRFHVEEKGWSDIAYSFGVCPHGIRFVGRGWDKLQFANGSDVVGADDGKDSVWFSVLVFIGWNADAANPVDEEPTPAMIEGVADLIEEGRSTRRCGWRVLPHNAFKPKRCPGATFTRLAALWNGKPITPDEENDMDPQDVKDIKDRLSTLQDHLERLTTRSHLDDVPPGERAVVERRVSALYLAMLADKGEDVDEEQLAALILEKLTPEAIAAALPDEVAEQVVTAIAARLASPPDQ